MHKKPPASKTSNFKINTLKGFSLPSVTALWMKNEKESQIKEKSKKKKKENSKILTDPSSNPTANLPTKTAKNLTAKKSPKNYSKTVKPTAKPFPTLSLQCQNPTISDRLS